MLYDFNMCLQILVWEYRKFHRGYPIGQDEIPWPLLMRAHGGASYLGRNSTKFVDEYHPKRLFIALAHA